MSELTKEQYEQSYNKIVKFYDLADDLLSTVNAPGVKDPLERVNLVEPLVKKVEEATDTIATEYREFVATGKKPGILGRKRIEKALYNLYEIINTYKELETKTKKITDSK